MPRHVGDIAASRALQVGIYCDAPRPMCQVSSSYSPSLPCHSLACCILPCHRLHFIIMFFKTCIRSFSPLSVSRSDTLARARHPSQSLFREREKNILGMGRNLPSGLGISPAGRPSNFVPFGGRLMPQRLTELTESPFCLAAHTPPNQPTSPS